MHKYSQTSDGVLTITVTGPQPPTIWSYDNMPHACARCGNQWCHHQMGAIFVDGAYKNYRGLKCKCGWRFIAAS